MPVMHAFYSWNLFSYLFLQNQSKQILTPGSGSRLILSLAMKKEEKKIGIMILCYVIYKYPTEPSFDLNDPFSI